MKRRERVRRFTRSLARSLDAAHARRTRRTRGTRTHRRAHAGCEQSAATTMMTPKRPQTSPGSVLSLRGGANAPGSPAAAAIARVDDGVMVYKDLAALPRDKAILDIERPDLMTYELHYSYSPLGVARSPSPGSSFSPPTSPEESRMWLEKSSPAGSSPASAGRKRNGGDATPSSHAQNTQAPKILQHFHRPDNGSNIYKKPPIYRRGASSSALPAGKHLEDLIIESSKFPAAEPPDPNAPSKIETEHWPCPPSSAVFEKEKACRRSEGRREEEEEREEEESTWGLRALHRQELNKIRSNIGRIILKEELEKSAAPLRRKTRSLPDRSQHAGAATSRALCFPASSGAGLARLQSTEFSPAEKPAQGVQNGDGAMDRGRSLPSVLEHKIYPYETLVVNHRGRNQVPPGVDRTQLERHLSREEFASVFAMMPEEFEQLSLWRRNHLKKRACLF
ncbi:dematin-like isoform X6 [Hippocampus zosterae]|uniref:dematin-like isoform X6 n=1 Tax=Hippocampus zosterae TaxID=109293 RepID=UPI00223D7F85|nr:dematin-like isoform X6 [Hippocampus zosterae]